MKKINKEDAIKIIVDSAKLYKERLSGKNLLFLYRVNQSVQYIETSFSPSRFLHLTGVETHIPANEFYVLCLSSRLSPKDFKFKDDGTTRLKLPILSSLMKIDSIANMFGEYSSNKPILYTEKLAGNISGCMGFVKEKSNIFVPNTALQDDIRNLSKDTYQILATFSKKIGDAKYNKITYKSKKIDFQKTNEEKPCINIKIKIKKIITEKKMYLPEVLINKIEMSVINI